MASLFQKDIFFIYFLAILTLINYSSFDKLQKLSLIYFCTYGITFSKVIRIPQLIIFLVCTLFIYEEYLNNDTMKSQILYKFRYKMADYIYMYIFQYKVLWIVLGILFNSTTVKERINIINKLIKISVDTSYITIGFSILFFGIGINSLWTETVKFHTFDYLYNVMQTYPYYKINFSQELKKRLELVADIEDKTFFKRKKGYSIISLYFLQAWIQYQKQMVSEKSFSNIPFYKRCCIFLKRIFKRMVILRKCVGEISFANSKKRICRFIRKFVFGVENIYVRAVTRIKQQLLSVTYVFSRGHSTLGMQLVRIIMYEKGMSIGKPKSISGYWATLKRKIYEVLYCNMVFNGLEHYLSTNLCNPILNFRYYLVYQYLHIAQTKVGGKTYVPVAAIFEYEDVETWPIELVFISCLGLNSMPITKRRVLKYLRLYVKYGMTISQIDRIIDNINQ